METALVALTEVECSCDGTYAISEAYRAQKFNEGGTWNCPYCRTGWGYRIGEYERLREQIAERDRRLVVRDAQLDQVKADRDATTRSLNAQRSATTRIKNRVAHGVCPCCKRSFAALAKHMKMQHPEYAK